MQAHRQSVPSWVEREARKLDGQTDEHINQVFAQREFAKISDQIEDLRTKQNLAWTAAFLARQPAPEMSAEDQAEMARLEAELDRLMPAIGKL